MLPPQLPCARRSWRLLLPSVSNCARSHAAACIACVHLSFQARILKARVSLQEQHHKMEALKRLLEESEMRLANALVGFRPSLDQHMHVFGLLC